MVFIKDIIEADLHILFSCIGKVLSKRVLHTERYSLSIRYKCLRYLDDFLLFQYLGHLGTHTINFSRVRIHIIDNLLFYLAGNTILITGCNQHIALYQYFQCLLYFSKHTVIVFWSANIRLGDIFYRGVSIGFFQEMNGLQQGSSFYILHTFFTDMIIRLFIAHTQCFRNIFLCLTA